MNFVDELKWRGMIHDIMPGTEELLAKGQTTAYVGIDPTADSLHVGHLVSVMMMKHFQMAGHKPIFIIGGATGMIGDPSGKSQERNLLDEETIRKNMAGIKAQLSRFIDFNSTASNAAIMLNNYDWMKQFSFLDFIREIGKHITVNYMMAKDSVKNASVASRPRVCRLQNSPISWCRDTISFICVKTTVVCCRWEVPTNGEIFLPEAN